MSDTVPKEAVVVGEVLPPEPKDAKPWQFKKGDPRINRKGRIPGSRNVIGQRFIDDLLKWHKKHGMKAIEKVGREKPEELLRIIAGLVPKQEQLDVRMTGAVAVQSIDLQEIERRTHELLSRIEMGSNPDAGAN